MEDAYLIGINQYASIIDNGDYSLGTVLSKTSPSFNQIYDSIDIVISKGQANYECLSEEEKNIYFLLFTKCKTIAIDIGTKENCLICKKSMNNFN